MSDLSESLSYRENISKKNTDDREKSFRQDLFATKGHTWCLYLFDIAMAIKSFIKVAAQYFKFQPIVFIILYQSFIIRPNSPIFLQFFTENLSTVIFLHYFFIYHYIYLFLYSVVVKKNLILYFHFQNITVSSFE